MTDRDKDGVNDEEDKCPDVAGSARYDGCPVPDSDGDGVNDDLDKCKDVAGPASNNGCPVVKAEEVSQVKEAASRIYFETGSARLKVSSNAALDKIAQILNTNTQAKLKVEGHTDNTGSAQLNVKLSTDRAAAVKTYLIRKGIAAERVEAEGFGASKPIANNGNAAGRAKNRRVEMTIE